ncbi:MAG: Flp pilus assembly protein CpaB, partial [Nitrospira sp.]|nr:Flp pilus assembly protein CpaB [Nitrospira sp.]
GIRVNPESIAGGFASLPGARVNIMLTVRRSDDKGSYSKILLENILVLAADQQSIRNESGGPMLANVVTVALKAEDSLRLELAKQIGTISLALRKFNDTSLAKTDRINVESLLGIPPDNQQDQKDVNVYDADTPPLAGVPTTPKEPKPAAAPPKEPPKSTAHTIVIREGSKIRHAVVELGDAETDDAAIDEGPSAAQPQPSRKKD